MSLLILQLIKRISELFPKFFDNSDIDLEIVKSYIQTFSS